jgi:hypothetical protein
MKHKGYFVIAACVIGIVAMIGIIYAIGVL